MNSWQDFSKEGRKTQGKSVKLLHSLHKESKGKGNRKVDKKINQLREFQLI